MKHRSALRLFGHIRRNALDADGRVPLPELRPIVVQRHLEPGDGAITERAITEGLFESDNHFRRCL